MNSSFIVVFGQCLSVLLILSSAPNPMIFAQELPQKEERNSAGKDKSVQRKDVAKYFAELKQELKREWPKNRLLRFVFHGHSVPAGYFRTPQIRRFDSYPILFHEGLCKLHSTAVIDVCTTAIGGENSVQGSQRFERDVLALRPDVIFIDYALNDRRLGLDASRKAWREMIESAVESKVKVVLLTPTPDSGEDILDPKADLASHSRVIRDLGEEFDIPVVDVYSEFRRLVSDGVEVTEFLSQRNHPNRRGHQLVASKLLELFD